jgi:hypothetical protein
LLGVQHWQGRWRGEREATHLRVSWRAQD